MLLQSSKLFQTNFLSMFSIICPIMLHYLAGNYLPFFLQPEVKGDLGIDPWTLRFPAWCHGNPYISMAQVLFVVKVFFNVSTFFGDLEVCLAFATQLDACLMNSMMTNFWCRVQTDGDWSLEKIVVIFLGQSKTLLKQESLGGNFLCCMFVKITIFHRFFVISSVCAWLQFMGTPWSEQT